MFENEALSAISKFFSKRFLTSALNATILDLIPKFSGTNTIYDLVPNACLNTFYKVISWLLVKLRKTILSDLILPNKITFVRGRILLDSTLLASETDDIKS